MAPAAIFGWTAGRATTTAERQPAAGDIAGDADDGGPLAPRPLELSMRWPTGSARGNIWRASDSLKMATNAARVAVAFGEGTST